MHNLKNLFLFFSFLYMLWQTTYRFQLFPKPNYSWFVISESCYKRILLFRNFKIRYPSIWFRCIPRQGDYDNLCFPIRRGGSSRRDCVSLVRSFPVCQPAGRRVTREQISNITSYVDGSNIYGINITAPLVRNGNCK